MRFISFLKDNTSYIGLYFRGKALPLVEAAARLKKSFPVDMKTYLQHLEEFEPVVYEIARYLRKGDLQELLLPWEELNLQACVPYPVSCRDAYSFRQHVKNARKTRGAEVPPEYDKFPVFYYTNHNAIIGPGPVYVQQDHLVKLDFELEIAAVIGKKGKNIPAEEADEYIYGYTIMNDFSARYIQAEEMKLSLGPAKGKDFATALGPFLTTREALKDFVLPAKKGHVGERYNLVMKAHHNNKLVSLGNAAHMDWTFAEIIERISYGTTIYPGDVIGSGTVGSGCFLEINLINQEKDPNYTPVWLQNNDVIELEIDFLGKLKNTIVLESEYSLLQKQNSIQI